jgi:hypothetical protein
VLELTSRLARLVWKALDRVDYALTLARCWVVDRIYGLEPPTPADIQREAEHERLREAFPTIGLDGTIAVDGKAQVEPGAVGFAQVSDPTEPKPGMPADRLVD